MDKLITNISVSFVGIRPRCRKPERKVLHIKTIDGHNQLSSDDLSNLAHEAWDLIDRSKIKLTDPEGNPKNIAALVANKGRESNEMRFVELIPSQLKIIMR